MRLCYNRQIIMEKRYNRVWNIRILEKLRPAAKPGRKEKYEKV